jgi:hypothetical protein
MYNILNHKRTANENYTEIPSHSSQNGCYQENKQQTLMRMSGGDGILTHC